MSWIRRETEKGAVQYICPHCHDYHEFREDFGGRTFSENYIFCRRCGARNGTGNAPTLTQPNEPLTLEMVAEILAEQFGDECACNVNGNDEWLPMMCHYADVCPDPPEHLGCWMELLRNKYRRPPEGEEDT